MSTIPKAASDAAEYAVADVIGRNKSPSVKAIADAAILAALPHMSDPVLLNEIRKILDEHSAWIARPNQEVDSAIALCACLSAMRVMGAWCNGDAHPAPAVQIKPLKWREEYGYLGRAETSIGIYCIEYFEKYDLPFRLALPDGGRHRAKTEDAAKAAAQADYEARIRSALVSDAVIPATEQKQQVAAHPVDEVKEKMAGALFELVWADAVTTPTPESDGERHVHLDITLSEWEAARVALAAYEAEKEHNGG